jgi:hypothetical protein
MVGGSSTRELTPDDGLVSQRLSMACGENLEFVNAGSSNQTFAEAWNLVSLFPRERIRAVIVGLNYYKLSEDDTEVISQMRSGYLPLPIAPSLSWYLYTRTGRIVVPMNIFELAARTKVSVWRLAALIGRNGSLSSLGPPSDVYNVDRNMYRSAPKTAVEKDEIVSRFLAERTAMFREKSLAGAALWRGFADHFSASSTNVGFMLLPEDPSMQRVSRVLSDQLRSSMAVLSSAYPVLDLRTGTHLEPSDFYDQQHLLADGRKKILPALLSGVEKVIPSCAHG